MENNGRIPDLFYFLLVCFVTIAKTREWIADWRTGSFSGSSGATLQYDQWVEDFFLLSLFQF
jgi:hypothetical protein